MGCQPLLPIPQQRCWAGGFRGPAGPLSPAAGVFYNDRMRGLLAMAVVVLPWGLAAAAPPAGGPPASGQAAPGAETVADEEQAPARQVELAVGQQRVFALEGVSRVSLGGDSVAAEPLGEERLLLVGRRAGRSELVLLFADGRSQVWRLRVVDDAAARFRDNCAALLGTTDCAGLQVVAAGDELVLEGRVDDLQTYHRLRSIRRAFPEVRLLVEVDPAVLDGLVRAINAELAAAGLDRARVTRVGGRLLIEGTVAGAVEKRKAAAIVAAMLDQAIGG